MVCKQAKGKKHFVFPRHASIAQSNVEKKGKKKRKKKEGKGKQKRQSGYRTKSRRLKTIMQVCGRTQTCRQSVISATRLGLMVRPPPTLQL